MFSLSTQSLASCVNYFVWNCLPCFSNTKIGSVTSFSILFNFQGPVRLSLAADDLIILPQKRFFVKHFFEKLLKFCELKSFSSFSVLTGTFERSLVLFKGFLLGLQKSFFCLSAWRSSIIPYTGVDVNTFLQVFSKNFKLLRSGRKLNPSGTATAAPAPLFQGELAVLRALLYYIITL